MSIQRSKIIGFLLLFFKLSNADLSESEEVAEKPARDVSRLRLMVIHPNMRPSEPYTYPGPSPHIKLPPRYPEPYNFMQPFQRTPTKNQDFQSLPRWCKNMWEREDCGMKCWMLRKICKNISHQPAEDSEGSHSMTHPMYYMSYYPKPSVAYSKAGVANTYFAEPSWTYAPRPIMRRPYPRYPIPMTNEIGLNPQFTYVDGMEKLKTTTEKSEEKIASSTSNGTTEVSSVTARPAVVKGSYPVKIMTSYKYPADSEVTTLSPLMFEYDQHGTKGYYGDRIYMSAVLPVADRQFSRKTSVPYYVTEESYDDFDENLTM